MDKQQWEQGRPFDLALAKAFGLPVYDVVMKWPKELQFPCIAQMFGGQWVFNMVSEEDRIDYCPSTNIKSLFDTLLPMFEQSGGNTEIFIGGGLGIECRRKPFLVRKFDNEPGYIDRTAFAICLAMYELMTAPGRVGERRRR